MKESIRTFIAIKIRPETKLLRTIDIFQKNLDDEGIKWVDADKLHLTLKFLGDTPVSEVENIKVQQEKLASEFQPFNLSLSGIGFFKSKRQPKVLFVNTEQSEPLKEIFFSLEDLLEEFGFKPESRTFKPHLTIARVKYLRNIKKFYELVEQFKNENFQEQQVSEIIFYESILKPRGPVYKALKIVELTG